MNIVDVIAVLLVVAMVIFGWRSGFIVQAFALAGLVAGLAALVLLAPLAAELVSDTDPLLRTLLVIGFMAGVVLLIQGIGSAIGAAIRRRLGGGILGKVDMGAGAVFGAARGVFLVWLFGGLIGLLPLPGLAADARQSLILRALDTRLPSPVVLAAELGRLIQAYGLPDIFVGAPPPAAPPLDGPALEQVEAMAARARASTVRVEAIACGHFLTGTGFAVRQSHFVTNAHVVAGGERVWVSFDGSLERHAGVVVDFDPSLDVAVIQVAGLSVAPLTLADEPPERGQAAAAIGFTGGGNQRLVPAVVSRTVSALGRNIYGDDIVARDVIELHADVAPGDSGGPLLVDDRTVGGVTFSESETDPGIGYALTPTAVAASIRDSLASTTGVATGNCIR